MALDIDRSTTLSVVRDLRNDDTSTLADVGAKHGLSSYAVGKVARANMPASKFDKVLKRSHSIRATRAAATRNGTSVEKVPAHKKVQVGYHSASGLRKEVVASLKSPAFKSLKDVAIMHGITPPTVKRIALENFSQRFVDGLLKIGYTQRGASVANKKRVTASAKRPDARVTVTVDSDGKYLGCKKRGNVAVHVAHR